MGFYGVSMGELRVVGRLAGKSVERSATLLSPLFASWLSVGVERGSALARLSPLGRGGAAGLERRARFVKGRRRSKREACCFEMDFPLRAIGTRALRAPLIEPDGQSRRLSAGRRAVDKRTSKVRTWRREA